MFKPYLEHPGSLPGCRDEMFLWETGYWHRTNEKKKKKKSIYCDENIGAESYNLVHWVWPAMEEKIKKCTNCPHSTDCIIWEKVSQTLGFSAAFYQSLGWSIIVWEYLYDNSPIKGIFFTFPHPDSLVWWELCVSI